MNIIAFIIITINKINLKNTNREFLEVQWLGLSTFIAEGPGSIPGWGTKIPQVVQSDKKRKKGTLPPLKPKIPQKTLYYSVSIRYGFVHDSRTSG